MTVPYPCYPDMSPMHVPVECVTIDLQDITIHGGEWPGASYGLSDWDGWDNGVDAVGGPVAYPSDDGGIETVVAMKPRTITLEGDITARDWGELQRMIDRMGKVLTRPRWDWMTVTARALDGGIGLERMIRVCRLVRPKITPTTPTSAVFTLELQAADWRKVDTVQSTQSIRNGQTKSLANDGDEDADLFCTLAGPMTNPTLTWPGGSWQLMATIGAGETRTVTSRSVRDPATSAAYLHKVVGVWPSVPSESSVGVAFSCTGATSATEVKLSWRSTWS